MQQDEEGTRSGCSSNYSHGNQGSNIAVSQAMFHALTITITLMQEASEHASDSARPRACITPAMATACAHMFAHCRLLAHRSKGLIFYPPVLSDRSYAGLCH
jgi:hypothetical protein